MFWTWESSRLKYRKLSWRDDIPRITHCQKYNFTSVFSDPGNVSAQAFRTSRPRRADGKHPEEKVYGISARRGGDPASSGWTCWVSSTSIAAKQGDQMALLFFDVMQFTTVNICRKHFFAKVGWTYYQILRIINPQKFAWDY